MTHDTSLSLPTAQVQELDQIRDHHPKAYVRVKAAGILKVWQGASRRQVAKSGLLKPVRRETVQAWILRYQHDGVAGLLVQPGRGRKRAFSRCA
jgi:transposase